MLNTRRHLLTPLIFGGSYVRKLLSVRRDLSIGVWPYWEAAGPAARNITNIKSGSVQFINNPGFEDAGAGGADIWAYWSERASDGALANEGVIVKSGNDAAKMTAGAGIDTWVSQDFFCSPGEDITFTFWARGDGANSGRYQVYDVTNATPINTLTTVGVTGASYVQKTFVHAVPAGCYKIRLYLACPALDTAVSYFDDVAVTGIMELNGVNSAAGITYGQPGIGDGRTCYVVDGNNTHSLIGSKGFADKWDGNLGSAIIWMKMDGAGRWTDANVRYPLHIRSRLNSLYYIVMGRSSVDKKLMWRRRTGGNANEQLYTFGTGPLGWFCMGYCWDQATPNLRGFLYVPGSVPWEKIFDVGGTDMNDWSNVTQPADDDNTALLAASPSAQEWIGSAAYAALWAGGTLSDADMMRAMKL